MIDLHYWPTPNGHKITMFLEEAELDYRIVPVNIMTGDQLTPAFRAIAPNGRIPAIVDHAPAGGGAPISVFESGQILLYLAEKTGRFMSTDLRGRVEVLQWLFWQMAGLGPMAGQYHHFADYSPERIAYAVDRYRTEIKRLYGVLDARLSARPFIAGESYTIADMASYTWIVPHKRQQQDLADFPQIRRWFAAIRARPATVKAYALGKEIGSQPTVNEQSRSILFGQTAATLVSRNG